MSSIKNILKKILPRPFLKEAFLVYNKFRILTLDRLLFPEYEVGRDQFSLYRKGFPFREEGVNIDDLPADDVKRYMESWFDWTQEEFILEFDKPCWIEPKYGWAIVEPNKLIYYSLGVSRTWFQPKPDLLSFLRKKNIIHVPKAISLRDSGEENYFHFYNDVLGKLFFLRQRNFDVKNIPVILSKRLWEKPYFKHYYEHSEFLQSLTWIIQDTQYIQCDHAIFCKPLTHRRDLWSDVLQPLKKEPGKEEGRRIFLTRNKTRLRFIENAIQIESIVKHHGFEVIDTDELSPEQQIRTFSSTAMLIGIHGAGLMNMAFRNSTCSVLELFPPPDLGYLPYHYILLARMLGFQYRALIGEQGKIKYSGGFFIDPQTFEKTLLAFIGLKQL